MKAQSLSQMVTLILIPLLLSETSGARLIIYSTHCYDEDGKTITCLMSKTKIIILCVVVGVVILTLGLAGIFYWYRRRRTSNSIASEPSYPDLKGRYGQIPSTSTLSCPEHAYMPRTPSEGYNLG